MPDLKCRYWGTLKIFKSKNLFPFLLYQQCVYHKEDYLILSMYQNLIHYEHEVVDYIEKFYF